MNTKRLFLLAAGLLLLIVTAACGNNQENEISISNLDAVSISQDDSALFKSNSDNVLTSTQIMTARSRNLGLENVPNGRDLGGYITEDGRKVRAHKLIRSAEIANLTDADVKKLIAQYNVNVIFDLRCDYEYEGDVPLDIPIRITNLQKEMPDGDRNWYTPESAMMPLVTLDYLTDEERVLVAQRPKYEDFSLQYVSAYPRMREFFQVSYQDFVTANFPTQLLTHVFDVLLETEDGAVMWYCKAGKDRTGMVTAIILSALGVERESIYEDYMMSSYYLQDYIKDAIVKASKETNDQEMLDEIWTMYLAESMYLDSMFLEIDTVYGSMDSFLEEALGLTPEKGEKLKAIYLE